MTSEDAAEVTVTTILKSKPLYPVTVTVGGGEGCDAVYNLAIEIHCTMYIIHNELGVNPRLLSANRVGFGIFCFCNISKFTLPRR